MRLLRRSDRAARIAARMLNAARGELGPGTLAPGEREDLAVAVGFLWAAVWMDLSDEERQACARASLEAGAAATSLPAIRAEGGAR